MNKVHLSSSYRKKFKVTWSFVIGYTINTNGLKGFDIPHNLPSHRNYSVCIKDPLQRSILMWKKELWRSAQNYLRNYNLDFVNGLLIVKCFHCTF